MKTAEIIAGSIVAILMGTLLGYILYRFRIIIERRRLTRNVDKKIEKQEKRELLIGGVKVEENRDYRTGGEKVDIGKETKVQKKEVVRTVEIKKTAHKKPKDEKNIKKKERKTDKAEQTELEKKS